MFDSVIFLAPFPLVNADGGGLIRSRELREFLRENSSNFVDVYCYDSRIWGNNDFENHFVMPLDSDARLKFKGYSNYCADLDITDWCANNNDEVLKYVKSKVGTGKVTIWFEYPWLWKLADKIRAELKGVNAYEIIYSSGNIESEVYGEILDRHGAVEFKSLPDIVRGIEVNAVRISDVCIACSEADQKILNNFGAKRTELIPNGVSDKCYEVRKIFESSIYSLLEGFDYYFYAASDWPPNVSCIKELVGDNLGFIPPDKKIVIAGGASRVFNELYLDKSNPFYSLNSERMITLGRLNDIDYKAAHTLASGYLLPVSYGGGTCLKTAEALFTGKHVIATKSAARGYEAFFDLPNFSVVDDCNFSTELAISMTGAVKKFCYNITEANKLINLTWKSHLGSFLDKV